MNWTPSAGSTLLMPSGPKGGNHLFVVLHNPCLFDGYGPNPCVAQVSLTSVVADVPGDPACEISKGEHPFVVHDTYVAYRFIRLEQASHLVNQVRNGLFIPKEPVSQTLLGRIRAGLHASLRTPRIYKRMFSVWPS